MTRITFLQPHLRFGDAERQTVLVANRLSSQGQEVHLLLRRRGEGLASELSDAVVVHGRRLESYLAVAAVGLRLRLRLHKVLKQIAPSLVVVKDWSSPLACALVDRQKMEYVRPFSLHRAVEIWANRAERLLVR